MKKEGQYKTAWRYLKESTNYIYFIVGVFILSGIFGFIYHEKISFVDVFLRELIDKTTGLSPLSLIVFIFLNNLKSSLYGMAFGAVFGIFPILIALLNGSVIGYVLEKSWQMSGVSEFWRLFPHGIFELPAIFISLGLGIKLGFFIFEKNRKKTFLERVYKSILVFTLIVVPLLAIAAIIEGLLVSFYK